MVRAPGCAPALGADGRHVQDEPVDYAKVAAHLAATKGTPSVEVCRRPPAAARPPARAPGVAGWRPSEAGWAQCETEFESTWLDNSKAKFQLGWRPGYDMARLVDSAWAYERAPGDERVIYYPG